MPRYKLRIVPEGVATEDGRGITLEALTWRTGSLPLMWTPVQPDNGHEGQMVVGAFTDVRRDTVDGVTGLIADTVIWDTGPAAQEAKRMVDEGTMRALSADLDVDTIRIEAQGQNGASEWVEAGVLLGATLVPIQAAEWARVVVEDDEEDDMPVNGDMDDELDMLIAAAEQTITAGALPLHDYPIAARDREWDAAAAEGRWRTFTDSQDGPSGDYRNGFLWFDTGDADNFGAYKLGVVDVIDGTPHYVPRAVFAVAGGRGVNAADIPDADKATIRNRVCDLYDRINAAEDGGDEVECPFDEGTQAASASPSVTTNKFNLAWPSGHGGDEQQINEAITAHAAADFEAPPVEWFTTNEPPADDPEVVWVDADGKPVAAGTDGARPWGVPLTVTADGRVYGHIASWQDCHTGYPDRCVTPPKSHSEYAWFHTGATVTASGDQIPTGRITVGTGHAPHHLSATAALAHYDNTGAAVADVRASDGELGPWVSGWVRPWATAQQRHELAAHPPSGDWRPRGGHPELLGVLAVNQPGFPLPRTVATFRKDQLVSLVASGMPPRAAVVDDGLASRVAAIEARLDAEALLADLS